MVLFLGNGEGKINCRKGYFFEGAKRRFRPSTYFFAYRELHGIAVAQIGFLDRLDMDKRGERFYSGHFPWGNVEGSYEHLDGRVPRLDELRGMPQERELGKINNTVVRYTPNPNLEVLAIVSSPRIIWREKAEIKDDDLREGKALCSANNNTPQPIRVLSVGIPECTEYLYRKDDEAYRNDFRYFETLLSGNGL